MCAVDLDDRLNDPLFYPLHTIQFLVEYPARFFRIDCLKIISLPLNIHHDGKRPLGMSALLGRHFVGTCDRQISPRPESDIVRQSPPRAVHKICDALDAGQLHAVAGLLLILVRDLL